MRIRFFLAAALIFPLACKSFTGSETPFLLANAQRQDNYLTSGNAHSAPE